MNWRFGGPGPVMGRQLTRVRSFSISSLMCNFSIFSLTKVSVLGRGRWSSSAIRVSSEAWRSLSASRRAWGIVDTLPPIAIGWPCAPAIADTARYGSADSVASGSINRMFGVGVRNFSVVD